MAEFVLSEHAKTMKRERGIQDSWITQTLHQPEYIEYRDDGTGHYMRKIDEKEGKYLRVVVNELVRPARIVTMFFDRRVRPDHEA